MDCGSCPRAADGPFYTIPGNCLACMLPEHEAPALIGWHETSPPSGSGHCFFKKQPETPEELEAAFFVMHASCIANLRYRGRDPSILAALAACGLSAQCDHPRG